MTTNNDLNVSLARLMGWREIQPKLARVDDDGKQYFTQRGWMPPYHQPEPCDHCTEWKPSPDDCGTRWGDSTFPRWDRYLDALFAPGGPVEYANSKGLGVWLVVDGGAVARIMRNIWSKPIRVACADPAEALATALHEAFGKEAGA